MKFLLEDSPYAENKLLRAEEIMQVLDLNKSIALGMVKQKVLNMQKLDKNFKIDILGKSAMDWKNKRTGEVHQVYEKKRFKNPIICKNK